MQLIYGAGQIDREVPDVDALLREWRQKERDFGQLYLEYRPVTPPDRLVLEDLAVTMLVNSRVEARQAMGFFRNCGSLDLSHLPAQPLGKTSDSQRQEVADLLGAMTGWPGVGASVATKTLHKKRPALVPILDNMAIFGAYMNQDWPTRAAKADTIKAVPRMKEALDWIALDVSREENEAVWRQLEALEPERTRIEIFDMVWWMYFSPRRSGVDSTPPAR
jgi:Family of unknown function (DUF6308)